MFCKPAEEDLSKTLSKHLQAPCSRCTADTVTCLKTKRGKGYKAVQPPPAILQLCQSTRISSSKLSVRTCKKRFISQAGTGTGAAVPAVPAPQPSRSAGRPGAVPESRTSQSRARVRSCATRAHGPPSSHGPPLGSAAHLGQQLYPAGNALPAASFAKHNRPLKYFFFPKCTSTAKGNKIPPHHHFHIAQQVFGITDFGSTSKFHLLQRGFGIE